MNTRIIRSGVSLGWCNDGMIAIDNLLSSHSRAGYLDGHGDGDEKLHEMKPHNCVGEEVQPPGGSLVVVEEVMSVMMMWWKSFGS